MKSVSIIVIPTLAALFILVGAPAVFVFLQAIFPHLAQGSWQQPFTAFLRTFSDDQIGALLGSTLRLGFSVVLLSAALGVPLGALRALFNVPFARFWDGLFLAPFLLPPYIGALCWTLALQPRGYLDRLTGIHLGGFLFSINGLVFVMALNIFPVVYFAVSRSMAAAGGRLADVARVFGANPWRAFFRVTLPLALPAIAASLLLAFTLAIEEFGAPAALGGQSGVTVLTTAIERRMADWPIDLPGAAVLSLVLVALALTAFCLQRALLARHNYETTTGKPVQALPQPLNAWRWPVAALFATIGFLSTVVPIGSMVLTSLSKTMSGGLALSNFSTINYSSVFALGSEALSAFGTSLSLAFGTALLTGLVGLLAAWCVAGRRVRGAALIDGLSMLPAALPGIVVGVGLILLWNRAFWPVSPYNSSAILLLSYSCILLPYPLRYVSAALRQIGPNLEAAARVHGASPVTTLIRVVLPLVMPSLGAAMMIVFAMASRELVTSLLLAPPGVETLSTFVWKQFEQGSFGEGMALATAAVLASGSVMLLAFRLGKTRPA
jgi:iron(III) transport system permease protein